MPLKFTPTRSEGCQAKLLALIPGQHLDFNLKSYGTVKTTVSDRIKKKEPLRVYKVKSEPKFVRVTRMNDIVLPVKVIA